MKRRGGFILLAVLAIMLVMGLLAFGLHWQQSRARAVYLHQEADMQARQALEFELAQENAPTERFSEPRFEMAAKAETDVLPVSGALYTPTNLAGDREVRWEKSVKGRPGTSWSRIQLSTHNLALQFGKRVYRNITSEWLPYALLAPRGQATCESVVGWSNPPLDEKDRANKWSAVPARVGARSAVTVGRCDYGELFSEKGPIKVQQGAVLAQQGGHLPYLHRAGKDYEDVLAQQLEEAFNELAERALDKSDAIYGPLFGLHEVWGLFTGSRSFDRQVSLRQAMSFPFPMIPSFATEEFVTTIALHVPFPPDTFIDVDQGGQSFVDSARDASSRARQIHRDLYANDDPTTQQQKLDELKALKEQTERLASASQTLLKKLQTGPKFGDDGPTTRAGEIWPGDDGIPGWAYGRLVFGLLEIFIKLISGQFQSLGEAVSSSARLFHFGPKENVVQFQIEEDRFGCVATLNVPPGRSQGYTGDLTVAGDLWIQKGGSLVVRGNLTMAQPRGQAFPDPLTPQGRICLEEGATLLVTGNLKGAGGPTAGSVVVGAPAEGVHPVTAGLLVRGNIDLPYGILPAVGAAELIEGLEPVVQEQAPNLAKAAGPFHRRKSFFAAYATTILIIEWPWPPVTLVLPIPLPKENILNPVFNSLSATYTSHLNVRLGENFMTMTDWWFFGTGVVPMLPKIDPASIVEVKSLKAPAMPFSEAELESFTQEYVLEVVELKLVEAFSEIVVEFIVSNLGDEIPLVGDILTDVLASVINTLRALDKAQEVGSSISPVDMTGPRAQLASELAGGAVLPLLGECPGLLVYAGQDLSVASGPLATGFLVARGRLDCRTEYLVGGALSLEGDAVVKNLLYVPELTRAWLYVPEKFKDWQDASKAEEYGQEMDSRESVPVGPPVRHVRGEGWED